MWFVCVFICCDLMRIFWLFYRVCFEGYHSNLKKDGGCCIDWREVEMRIGKAVGYGRSPHFISHPIKLPDTFVQNHMLTLTYLQVILVVIVQGVLIRSFLNRENKIGKLIIAATLMYVLTCLLCRYAVLLRRSNTSKFVNRPTQGKLPWNRLFLRLMHSRLSNLLKLWGTETLKRLLSNPTSINFVRFPKSIFWFNWLLLRYKYFNSVSFISSILVSRFHPRYIYCNLLNELKSIDVNWSRSRCK